MCVCVCAQFRIRFYVLLADIVDKKKIPRKRGTGISRNRVYAVFQPELKISIVTIRSRLKVTKKCPPRD